MGGRGSISVNTSGVGLPLNDAPSGGTGGGVEFKRLPEKNESLNAIQKSLGKHGEPFDMVQAAIGANPYFNKNTGHTGYRLNCQRCVVAYELRRRGYDVRANSSFMGDKLPYQATKHGNFYWQGAFRHAKVENIKASTDAALHNKLEKALIAQGNGARGVIGFTYKRSRSGEGHVINYEVRKGKVFYIDAQRAVQYKNGAIPHVAQQHKVEVTRLDNLRVSARITKSVVPSQTPAIEIGANNG